MREAHPAGTVRHQNDDGEWIVADPRHPLYSMATMFAIEWWDSEKQEWRLIFDDEEGA